MTKEYSFAENEHPGIILKEEFLDALGISQNQLAVAAGVPRSRINQIVKGRRSITATTSIRIGRALGMSDFFFLTLQIDYDKLAALRSAGDLSDVVPIKKKAA